MNIHDYGLIWKRFPRSSLLLVTLPLLFINGGDPSLVPYDEGYYAVQARWIWETGDWLTPQWWGTAIYDRTIGIQWFIALAYQCFGLNEFSARLPSTIACIVSVLLTYEVGKILFDRQIAWLGAVILMLMGLWVSEAHTAQQNTALVAIELLGMWALLKIADSQPHILTSSRQSISMSRVWGILGGATVGWGFLLKGFMIFVPIIALLPYFIFHRRYQKLITNPWIYLGLFIGAIPTGIWLILSCYKYNGLMPVYELVNKLLFLSKTDTYNPGPFYYLWILPLNIFPWAFFSTIGAIIIWRRMLPDLNYAAVSLSLGYPICLFILLSLFKTRMAYYTMQLLPFMALLAATAFVKFMQVSRQKIGWYRFVTAIGYAFSGLGFILTIAGIIVMLDRPLWGIIIPAEVQIYALPAIVLGCGWMTIFSLWQRWQPPATPFWLAGWLIPAWLTILSFNIQGALTSKSPEFKTAFYQLMSERALIQPSLNIANQPINLLVDTVQTDGFEQMNNANPTLNNDEHKSLILLTFYTPRLGKQLNSFTDLPDKSYAWTLKIAPQLASKTRIVGKVSGWQLIQKIGDK
ncbi:glycosyltransferase family 39 protein [Chamaesiphon sp. VAR_48_metabat_403]|uniref:ArnT family glycosyltransferase n=1 Tax=Chamaesiphon sp. VAR_48_metabat_403 TaxID=2964700 RepID=UPI00286E3055|nr:glycosyltransferase family 39 protein [Chamaesiphon sp. VAR_48_metabat_403]